MKSHSLVKPLESVEISPRSKSNGAVFVCACLVFVYASISLLLDGNISDRLVGSVGLVFFGAGGLIAVPKLLRRRNHLRLTPEGVEQITPHGVARIPWTDIEAIGTTTRFLQKLIGLRLSGYDHYLAEVSDEQAGKLANGLPLLKLVSRAMRAIKIPDAPGLWSRLSGEPSVSDALNASGQVGKLAEMLLWNRTFFEYEILLGWGDMDCPADELVRSLKAHHVHYTRQVP